MKLFNLVGFYSEGKIEAEGNFYQIPFPHSLREGERVKFCAVVPDSPSGNLLKAFHLNHAPAEYREIKKWGIVGGMAFVLIGGKAEYWELDTGTY